MWRHKITGKNIRTSKGVRIQARLWKIGVSNHERQVLNKRFKSNHECLAFVQKLNDADKAEEIALTRSKKMAWPKLQFICDEYLRLSQVSDGWLKEQKKMWKHFVEIEHEKKSLAELTCDKFSPRLLLEIEKKLKNRPAKSKAARTAGQRTINLKLAFLKRLLSWATENRYIPNDPIGKVKVSKPDEKIIDFWSREEALAFLDFANKKYPPGTKKRWVYVLYLTALNTALRAGELWAMKPNWRREAMGRIHVLEQWSIKEQKFKPTKGHAQRIVGLIGELDIELLALATVGPFGLYFTNNRGGPVDHSGFLRNVFNKDLAEAGLRKISFHGLRHTAATLMLSSGVNVKTLQKILGHKHLNTTMRYLHALAVDLDEVAQKHSLVPAHQKVQTLGKKKSRR